MHQAVTFRDLRDIQRRENAGEPVTAAEREALTRYREDPRTIRAAAMACESDKALKVVDTMPAKRRASFEHRTIAQTRHDCMFQMYARRLRTPALRLQPRPVARGCSRPRARRSSSSSRTSGTDPGAKSGSDSDPPARAEAHRVALGWLAAGSMLVEREEAKR